MSIMTCLLQLQAYRQSRLLGRLIDVDQDRFGPRPNVPSDTILQYAIVEPCSYRRNLVQQTERGRTGDVILGHIDRGWNVS